MTSYVTSAELPRRLVTAWETATRCGGVLHFCRLGDTIEPCIKQLAGHPRSGCPARLRGHKGSGLWKVWTVPSPPLPSPSPPLPYPPLPPACQIWSSWVQPFGRNYSPPKRASVAPPWRSASGHEGFPPCWSSRGEKCCFENVELRELWFESGLMNGPLHTPQGRWSECHRVRTQNAPGKAPVVDNNTMDNRIRV